MAPAALSSNLSGSPSHSFKKEKDMSDADNRDFIIRYGQALSGKPKPPALLDEFMTDEALKEHIAQFEAAFPGYELIVDDILADGDKVCLRGTFRGVHQHEFMGIPASGREVTTSLTIIYRIQDGKIVEHWLNADSLTLLQQLGAVPAMV
jgi:predicted ester cyclase